MLTTANVATTHDNTVPTLRSGEPAGASRRAMRARLSARNASAVVGAIGMKLGGGLRKSDQRAAQPINTTPLCAATTSAARTAARVRSRSTLAVLIYSRLKSCARVARSRVTTFCVSADPYECCVRHYLAVPAVVASVGSEQPGRRSR